MTDRRIGPYLLERRLGRGGMGEVWLARDPRLERPVAIKHILGELAADAQSLARFHREATHLARLQHPSIVQVFDILEPEPEPAPDGVAETVETVETVGGRWIVMEYIAGPSLADRLRGRPLPLERALDLGRQIAEGLAAAQAEGIIHRDLKTENVMLTPSGHAKILDFGLAKRLEPALDGTGPDSTLTQRGQIMGTGRAMSPEQARGLGIDARSDLFSFGVLLYELLTGISPFRGTSFGDTLARVCGEAHPPLREHLPEAPEALGRLVDRLLEKDPAQRPRRAAEVAEELRRIERAQESGGPRDGGFADVETVIGEGQVGERPVDERPLADSSTPTHLAPPTENPAPRRRRRRFAIPALLAAGLALLVVFLGRDPAPIPSSATADPHSLYSEGMALLQGYGRESEIDRAATLFQEAIQLDPASAPAYAGLARARWRKHFLFGADKSLLETGLAAAEQAVELDAYLVAARISRAFLLIRLERLEEARRDLDQAATLDPDNADVQRGLADIAVRQDRLDEAEGLYGRAIELRPDDPELPNLLGDVHLRAGRYAEARAAFEHSAELAPGNFYAHRNLGAVAYLEDRLADAARAFQKALEARPDASVYTNLGTLLYAQGLYSQALDAYQHALELGTLSHDPVLWGNLGDAHRRLPGHDDDARTAYRRAVQLLRTASETPSPTRKSRMALYLAKQDVCEEARREIAGIAASDTSPSTYNLFRLAQTHEICGDRRAALDVLEKALESGFSKAEIEREPELFELRRDPRFQRLLADTAD